MKSRKNVPSSMFAADEPPLRTRKAANQPPRRSAFGSERRSTPRNPAITIHCSTRTLQKNSRRPSKFRCSSPQSKCEVLREPRVGRCDDARRDARGHVYPRRAEERDRPEPARLPESEREHGQREPAAERQRRTPPARDREREHRTAEEEGVRGLDADREPGQQPGRGGIGERARIERANHEVGRPEHDHHRREVAEPGQAERLRQELVDVLLVVAVDEQRDRRRTARAPRARRRGSRSSARRCARRCRTRTTSAIGASTSDLDQHDRRQRRRGSPRRRSSVNGTRTNDHPPADRASGMRAVPERASVVQNQIWSPPW